jgi:hypothetical protein
VKGPRPSVGLAPAERLVIRGHRAADKLIAVGRQSDVARLLQLVGDRLVSDFKLKLEAFEATRNPLFAFAVIVSCAENGYPLP